MNEITNGVLLTDYQCGLIADILQILKKKGLAHIGLPLVFDIALNDYKHKLLDFFDEDDIAEQFMRGSN